MLTISEILGIEKSKIARRQPSEEDLRRIPLGRPARITPRLSDTKQIHESLQSMAEIAGLVRLAREDGFRTEISQEEVERRLEAIKRGETDAPRYWVDGQIIVDLRDLGISGRLGPDKRPALAELMADLSRGEASDVTGTVYIPSEGVSRLSRDQDRIVGAQIIKLMKEANCRLRTPYVIYNPRIEADWKELREGFEDAAKESRHLQEKHFGPKRREKARRGEHVGNQVPPGFYVEIKGYKSNGSYIFGKWKPYQPHAEVVIKILQEYVRCSGSKYKAVQALKGTVFPFFPEELKYMRTRTSLRRSPQTEDGYVITPEIIEGLATNVAVIGGWKWGDFVIENNHPAIVPLDLFSEVYELATQRGRKPRGRAAYWEPLDWNDLLVCMNHETPRRMSGHGSEGRWVCDRDYHNGTGPTCLKIDHRLISEPLTKEFLKCLDLRSYANDVLGEVESRAASGEDEQARRKRGEAHLQSRLENLENYLGASDPELEESYRRQIKQVKAELLALQQRPPAPPVTSLDIARVRRFLENLEAEWDKLSSGLRNRLLKLLVDKVEVTHDLQRIRATLVWKTGFMQKIDIERPAGYSRRDWHWTDEQNRLLRMLWPTSTKEVILAAFPNRQWGGIKCKATDLGVRRDVRHYPPQWKGWTASDDERLAALYNTEISLDHIARELGRSKQAVLSRACMLKIKRPKELAYPRPKPVWEVQNCFGSETLSTLPPPSPVS